MTNPKSSRLIRGEVLKGHLELILLAQIQERPTHGYALIRNMEQRTNGALQLTEGTLYPVLHRLEAAGHLRSELRTVLSRRRRLYSLTHKGEKHLQRLLEEWAQFSHGIEELLRQAN